VEIKKQKQDAPVSASAPLIAEQNLEALIVRLAYVIRPSRFVMQVTPCLL
jgi:hypothetical protein